MQSLTRSIELAAAPTEVVRFLAQPANLPRWAYNYASEIKRQGKVWLAATSMGEMEIEIEADEDRGTVDIHSRQGDTVSIAYGRVIPNGTGSEYLFTMVQGPDVPDEVFASWPAALEQELARLADLLSDGAAVA